ncbi:Dbl homology domain-containing protein [Pholiota conissans]|uniref:Dbl homology domain-containing protein n=1 Tax=Pholiota conissans TaxID=109636 RepID=A0A9P5ZBZ3_9AGAR|nr:Dbl homology domain-containing protein [Pholiota conissans]
MKAFFHRLHIGSGAKDKDRDAAPAPTAPKEKFPPLPSWPPQSQDSHRPTSTSTVPPSLALLKPLPDLVTSQSSSQLSSRPLPAIHSSPSDSQADLRSIHTASTPKPTPAPLQIDESSQESATTSESTGRSSRKTNGSTSVAPNTNAAFDVQKKVAFISPPQTPVDFDRALPEAPAAPTPTPATSAPLKTTVSRFQAAYGKEPRASLSMGASSSKTDVSVANKTSVKATSTRTASPYLPKTFEAQSAQSLRSGTPYSQMSANTSGSRILSAQSWSEVTEEDLVSNIGSRERTRQEVLFEIISSEERYVQELVKMKDTFIDPLLHPYSLTSASVASTPNLDYDYYRSESPFESTDDLPPIAARFMSPTPSMNPPRNSPRLSTSPRPKDAPRIDDESVETEDEEEAADRAGQLYDSSRRPGTSTTSRNEHPRSPYRLQASRSAGRASGTSVPFPSRSHNSLPVTPRNALSASTHSLGRQSTAEQEPETDRRRKYSQGQNESPNKGMLRKLRRSQTNTDGILGNAIAPHQLPDDLRICLEVIDSGVFDGHKRLSEALKKRYDDQFPLVRSLADVFVSNSDIFHGYATYVLHLERALEQVDAALSSQATKKPKKQDTAEWQKVCKVLQRLEENAAEKGETGLAITLSKPFQRLLKYPLLFQNLLFHTDPSTFEYESTLQMVAEVENIVRSIEDEKIQKEERDKTRDVFARIEGLDKVRQLALPKPSRVLIEERPCSLGLSSLGTQVKPVSPPPVVNAKGIRSKSSFKRLSDVLQSNGLGGKKDLWFVVFNDVVLQCQRTGTTSLPLVASTNARAGSLPELQGKAKYSTTGRRNSTTKPRNMYKFIKIETWAIGDVLQPREGVVSMEDVDKLRTQALSSQPRIVPLPADDERENGDDSDDSDKKSKMSFSYWGADKVTVQKPVLKGRPIPSTRRGGSVASYGRESSANAKFGSRLISDGSHNNIRPASRRLQSATPVSRRPLPQDEGPNYARVTITPSRPAWDTSTRSPIPPVTKRPRNTSAVSPSTRTPNTNGPKSPVASPAPSEDSGVGLYRQMLANDPSLNNSA